MRSCGYAKHHTTWTGENPAIRLSMRKGFLILLEGEGRRGCGEKGGSRRGENAGRKQAEKGSRKLLSAAGLQDSAIAIRV